MNFATYHAQAIQMVSGMLIASLLSIGLGQSTFAQEQEKVANVQTPTQQDLSLHEQLEEYRISVNLESVTLEEFIAKIQSQLEYEVNLVIRKGAHDIRIPPIKLTNVSLYAMFNALEIATESEVVFSTGDMDEIAFIGRNEDFGQITQVNVLNVSRILASQNQESLLSAIEIGLQMMGSSRNNVELKLHEETKLLFVKGSADDTKIIMQIAGELGGYPTGGGGGPGGGGFGGGGGGLGDGSYGDIMSGQGVGGGVGGGQIQGRSKRSGGGVF